MVTLLSYYVIWQCNSIICNNMTVEIWHRIMPWEIKTKLINQNNTFIKTYEPVKNATKKTKTTH